MTVESIALAEQRVAARLERLPVSPWHIKMRTVVGVATFFDAFDALSIAYVLPALIGPWQIAPQQIGGLIAIGYAGQAIGAFCAGWIADRIGRINATLATVLIFAVMSFASAAATNYDQLFWARFIGGIGLGGEVPIAAAYISEIAKAKGRGRFFLLYEMVFQVGLVLVGWTGAYVVPRFGWQWMFVIGGVPAVLAFFMRRACPESPRWLASKGRIAEAERNLDAIEDEVSAHGTKPLPTVPELPLPNATAGPRWTELFQGRYRMRTLVVWLLWFCSYLVGYGMTTWLPTLYRTVYKLPVQEALNYSLMTSGLAFFGTVICTFVIDRTGRKLWFTGAFLVGCIALTTLLLVGTSQVLTVALLVSCCHFGISSISFSLYVYTPELYPTRIRGLGVSWATFWLRIASMIGPYLVGFLLPRYGVDGVFALFAAVALLGAAVCFFGAVETSGRVLEEVSP